MFTFALDNPTTQKRGNIKLSFFFFFPFSFGKKIKFLDEAAYLITQD